MKVQRFLFRSLSITIIYFPLLFSQATGTLTISGYVYDKSTGETLIGASVYLKGSHIGSSTNNNGYFVISNVPSGEHTISVSYLGYEKYEEKINLNNEKHILNIYLTPKAYRIGEVVVKSDSMNISDKLYSKPVSTIEMNAQQVNEIPKVVEADLLRALQTMPGITAISDFSSAIYVRGGTPDQNLYLVDGAEIYNPEHAFGIFSTFNTNAIKKVEVSKGGFDAQYGDRLSSVINVINLDGNRNKFEGNFNLSLIAASLNLQMPLGSFGSLSGSFRRTYIDQTYSKFIKNLPDYYFYDGNLKGFFQLGVNDNLTASYFKSSDNLNYTLNNNSSQSPHLLYTWGNTLGSLDWKHLFSNKVFSSFLITGTQFKSNFNFNQSQPITEINSLTDYTAKSSFNYYISNQFTLEAGAEYKMLHLLYNFDWNGGLVNIDYRAHIVNAYSSFTWKPNPLWNIDAGLRYNRFTSDKT
jgi:hypothetical protein